MEHWVPRALCDAAVTADLWFSDSVGLYSSFAPLLAYAAFGTIGLESAFGALNAVFSTKKTIDILTSGKRRFGIENASINIGNSCNITLFNPEITYKFENDHIASKSKNSMFIGSQLKGSVYGVIANQTAVLK